MLKKLIMLKRCNRKGFTLLEILIVITLIWLMAAALNNLDYNRATQDTKRDRFVWKIKNIIKTEITNSLIWKWFYTWTWTIPIESREIILSSWSIRVNYIRPLWAGIIYWEDFSKPFFWKEYSGSWDLNFDISKIERSDKFGSTWSISDEASLILKNWEIIFSWSSDPLFTNAVKISIEAWFKPLYKTIELDKRTWKIVTSTWYTLP